MAPLEVERRSDLDCIVVLDDDEAMRQMVVSYLNGQNVHAVPAVNRQEMLCYLSRDEPRLIILDLLLGREDGLDILREIRAKSDVPVIITTGHRREEIDRVVGLELGADDYLAKPFGLRELLARIRAVLRRREAQATQRPSDHGRLKFGGWILERRNRQLFDPTGQPVVLTKGEYALLSAFLAAPQRSLSREHLLQATRMHEDVFDRSIDVQVLRLRRKLEPEPTLPRVITTQRGVGYTFDMPVEQL